MESKHKNALIGALLAVVFVMAVGYAAFAQQLTINGTAEITSNWDIHFDPAYTTGNSSAYSVQHGTIAVDNGSRTVGVAPSGTIAYSNTPAEPLVATIDAELNQPGDKVTFTLKPTNYGAGLNGNGTMTVSAMGKNSSDAAHAPSFPTDDPSWADATVGNKTTKDVTGGKEEVYVVTKGYIKFTVTGTFASSLASGSADTIIVEAEYVSPLENATDVVKTSAGIVITLNYHQV